jgi:hypothetical protein
MVTSKPCLIRLTRQASIWPSLWPAQNISECSSKLMFLCSCHCRHSASLRIGTVAFCNILVPVLPVQQKVKLQYYFVSGLHLLCNILGRKKESSSSLFSWEQKEVQFPESVLLKKVKKCSNKKCNRHNASESLALIELQLKSISSITSYKYFPETLIIQHGWKQEAFSPMIFNFCLQYNFMKVQENQNLVDNIAFWMMLIYNLNAKINQRHALELC